MWSRSTGARTAGRVRPAAEAPALATANAARDSAANRAPSPATCPRSQSPTAIAPRGRRRVATTRCPNLARRAQPVDRPSRDADLVTGRAQARRLSLSRRPPRRGSYVAARPVTLAQRLLYCASGAASAARSGKSAQQQSGLSHRRTTRPRSTRQPQSAHSTCTSFCIPAWTFSGRW